MTIILGADECTCECTSNREPSLEGCRVATAIEIDPLQAICSSSRLRSHYQYRSCCGHMTMWSLTITQNSIFQHKPSCPPATPIIDPFAQEAFHVRWSTITLRLNHVILVLDYYQHAVQRHSSLDHRHEWMSRDRGSCHRWHLSRYGSRCKLTLLQEHLDPLICSFVSFQHSLPSFVAHKRVCAFLHCQLDQT